MILIYGLVAFKLFVDSFQIVRVIGQIFIDILLN